MHHIYSLLHINSQISSLVRMLCSADEGCSKNACFAIHNIATSDFGLQILVKDPNIDRILQTLSTLLMSYDEEIAKFAAMYASIFK